MSLLDASVLSEVRRADGDPLVKRRGAAAMDAACVGVGAMGESGRGVGLPPAAEKRRRPLRRRHDEMRDPSGDRIPPVARGVAERQADPTVLAQRNGRAPDTNGGPIAATAHANDLTLPTRNTRRFDGPGVQIFNLWED